MRVLVTGARGFVGGWLCPALEDRGFEVVATDRDVDVTDPEAVAASVAAARPDAGIHLAARSSVADSAHHAHSVYRVNFLGARAVLRAFAAHAPGARLILVGSGQIYGPGPIGSPPRDELAPLEPGPPYARAKAAADLLGAVYARRGQDVVRVRPFNHTGPGQSDAFAASSFARQIAEIELDRRPPVLEVGNLEAVRDFLDVADVVDAYAKLLDRRVPATRYNIASGVGTRVGHVLELLLSRARVRPEIRPVADRLRPADALVGDASRLRRATGWAPRVPLSDTLGRLLEHWRKELAARP